ncbi:MAG: hypothetical protein H6747_04885 [Deltaproteobacteria bacterium]|nr:hypothetical protein [Deltaproteobacteria bacterium]
MAKINWVGPVLSYGSAYGGESLRADAKTALRRLQAALQRCAVSDAPYEAELTIYDAQTPALQQATRSQGPGDDAVAAQARAEHGSVNPMVALAEAAFGPGKPQRFGVGAAGDLWSTTWKIEADATPEFDARWQAMAAFVETHGDAPKIHWSAPRKDEAPGDPQIELILHFRPVWTALDSATPLPGPPHDDLTYNHIVAFLHRHSSAIFSIRLPMAQVDATFAAWERAFCDALGTELVATRWSLESVAAEGFAAGHKLEQARYRRLEWSDDGKIAIAPPGPWDGPLDRLTAPRIKGSDDFRAREELEEMPIGPVAFGLIVRMGALKGAPLERGQYALSDLMEKAADRTPVAPALRWLMQNPPPSKQLRSIAYGFAPAASDPWLHEQAYDWLDGKKVPTPAWLFLDELRVYAEDDPSGDHPRALLYVTMLRKLREKGPESRRLQFCAGLTGVDQGSAWATVLLEAANPPKGHDDGSPYRTWAHLVLGCWKSRERVSDPRAAAFMAELPWVPRLGDDDYLSDPFPVHVRWSDEQTAALLAAERAWLGEAG